jgi:hypothetical protein
VPNFGKEGRASNMDRTTTTTLDPPTSLLLTIKRDDQYFLVKDHVGLRYGHSTNPLMALIAWWWQVQDLLDLNEPVSPELASEIRRYKQAIS